MSIQVGIHRVKQESIALGLHKFDEKETYVAEQSPSHTEHSLIAFIVNLENDVTPTPELTQQEKREYPFRARNLL